MPILVVEIGRRVLVLKRQGYSVTAIRQRLLEEHIPVSKTAMYSLLKKYERLKTIMDRPRSHFDKKLDNEKLRLMHETL